MSSPISRREEYTSTTEYSRSTHDLLEEVSKQLLRWNSLNRTLTATERTMCCILENYQREDGVEIPEVLRDFMGGKTFLPFPNTPEKEAKGKKSKA
ncbi:hypothetical protein RHGRI_000509 [Rhododendron griersonianum]|uniref:Uncharacterized protein n=1 Tax=Rhododendron griersonianum TaxID=479676 RepID=A0AAV6LHZ2_9ERIC|nr:hypothetical protein RHGRI_000509 [Rhododendron griersonianum]